MCVTCACQTQMFWKVRATLDFCFIFSFSRFDFQLTSGFVRCKSETNIELDGLIEWHGVYWEAFQLTRWERWDWRGWHVENSSSFTCKSTQFNFFLDFRITLVADMVWINERVDMDRKVCLKSRRRWGDWSFNESKCPNLVTRFNNLFWFINVLRSSQLPVGSPKLKDTAYQDNRIIHASGYFISSQLQTLFKTEFHLPSISFQHSAFQWLKTHSTQYEPLKKGLWIQLSYTVYEHQLNR